MMRWIGSRPQRTLCRTAEVTGIGYLTGADVCLRFCPAPPGTGVVFVRTDHRQRSTVLARVDQVTGTARRTTLGRAPAEVSLVEHVLAALAGLKIDNCRIEVDAPEAPGMDGSSLAFAEALVAAGTIAQPAQRGIYSPTESVVVRAGAASLAIHPSDDPNLTISYFLDYGLKSPLGRQVHTEVLTPGNFLRNLAPCRTFVLEQEIAELKKQGIGTRSTSADLLVYGPQGVIGNHVRFANEPARHKVLDLVGDLSLVGVDIVGHVVACRSGHPLNVQLAGELYQRVQAGLPRTRVAA